MLKGGVIMDVTTPQQAQIAQETGACAVMALERIPADIRAVGGVSRMSDPKMIQEIQNAVMPQLIKDQLLENNNTMIYEELGVSSFPQYVASYISRMVLNLISFLVTFLIAIIIVKALMFAVNIIGELPVLGLVNHIGGGALGLVLGLVIVWLGFLIITLLYTTEAGSACFEMIEKSSILTFLYDVNPLLSRILGFH